MRVLAVPKERAQDLLRILKAHRLVEVSMRISKSDREVFIPVVAEPSFELGRFGARLEDRHALPGRRPARDPWKALRDGLAAANVPIEHTPRRWKRIGDVLSIRLAPGDRAYAGAIAEVLGTVLGCRTVVEDRSGIHGPLRTPDVRVLWGDGTETVHVEGGIRYALDVAEVMLSPGNIGERMRIANEISRGSVVVDLFAGIGYFALPIAHHGARTVYACEVNPASYAYLLENIRLNRLDNVVPRLGDCRTVAPRGVADWVLMGHFDARAYLRVAFEVLRRRGTIVYHELCPKELFPEGPVRNLSSAARSAWRNVVATRTRIVKSYAPGIVHAVVEARVEPQTR